MYTHNCTHKHTYTIRPVHHTHTYLYTPQIHKSTPHIIIIHSTQQPVYTYTKHTHIQTYRHIRKHYTHTFTTSKHIHTTHINSHTRTSTYTPHTAHTHTHAHTCSCVLSYGGACMNRVTLWYLCSQLWHCVYDHGDTVVLVFLAVVLCV